jgi:hypothetical protein
LASPQTINQEEDILLADHSIEILSCPENTNTSSPPSSTFQDSSINIISVQQSPENNKSDDLPVTPSIVQSHAKEKCAVSFVVVLKLLVLD